jgi:DNA-binding NtrC family response regulator
MKPRLAVLDDEQRMVDILTMVLQREGYEVHPFTRPDVAIDALRTESFDLLITDLKMPGVDGLSVLQHAQSVNPELPVILITAHATVATALAAMREGAFDYVEKPFDNDKLKELVRRALDVTRLARENRYLRAELKNRYLLDGLVAESEIMREVLDLVRRAARSRSTVLITGESGTGKEMIARAVHYHSDRVGQPFIAVNCKAFAEGVLESELFGHEKGAFTGADRAKPGLFERAAGGTVFLDEIGEVSGDFQGKLLRVLQEKKLQRVGGTEERTVDIRVVAATNKDLRAEVMAGRFREDLYFRLAVIPVQLPPLHPWPGNVRELENTIERGVVLARGDRITVEDLLIDTEAEHTANAPESGKENLQSFLDQAAMERIRSVLKEVHGARLEAARRLGIDRTTLYRLMRKYKIGEED